MKNGNSNRSITAGSNGRRGKRFRKCYVYVFGRYASAFYAALPVDEIIGIKERPRGQKKEQEHKTLARWIIDKTNTDHYRAGMLSGWKHPYIDADVMESWVEENSFWIRQIFLKMRQMRERWGSLSPIGKM